MNWQPPPQKPGGTGGNVPPSGGGYPPPNGQQPASQRPEESKELSLYQLLQVDKDAHVTIIRYAYRFLAAMYHPDNGETGDAEKFRVITEAWKTLSDDGKRAAYDMSLGLQEQASGRKPSAPKPKLNEFGRDSLPNIPKTGLTWQETELRLACLQVMLAARKKRPSNGGASGKMLMDCLNIDSVAEIEFALWYLREKGWIESGERVFMITASGLDYLMSELNKTQSMTASSTEKKVEGILNSGLPAVIAK
jgi:hypothetical protein